MTIVGGAHLPSRWQSSKCNSPSPQLLLQAGLPPPFPAQLTESPVGFGLFPELQPANWGQRDSSLFLSVPTLRAWSPQILYTVKTTYSFYMKTSVMVTIPVIY